MLVLICLLSMLVHCSAKECSTTQNMDSTLKVYYNWPFTYQCISLINHEDFEGYFYDYYSEESEEYSCTITEVVSQETVFNFTFDDGVATEEPLFVIDSVTESTQKYYEVRLQKDSSCWFNRITLEPFYLVSETCEENLRKVGAIGFEQKLGGAFESICEIPDDAEDVPKRLVVNANEATKILWLYNCQETLPDNTMLGEDYSLYFTNISYQSNPGVYTCVVEHNGMRRYRIHRRMCVAPKVSSETSIKCSNQTIAIGDDAEVECVVDGGVGVDASVAFNGKFYKLNFSGHVDVTRQNSSCVAYAGQTRSGLDDRISCELFTEVKRMCFNSTPSEEELESQKTLYRLTYRIRNVQELDIGAYSASISRASRMETTTFYLFYDRKRWLIESNRLLAISLITIGAVSFFFLAFFAFWMTCSIEIRWMWFKICKPVEKGFKTYVAYLAYYYNKEMSTTQPSELEAFVMSLGRVLQKNGGKVFDRCRDPTTDQYTAGSISAKLSECHRVVIILTPEYVNDQWSVFEAYEAWKSVIENDIRIIFILFPNTMSAINKLPENSRTALKKALKRHSVITWDGTLPLTRRLKIKVELLMPKFDSNTAVEMVSPAPEENGVSAIMRNGNGASNKVTDANGNAYANIV